MENYRIYGEPPCSVAVIHGGPGAPGEMKPVAEELAKSFGVIEPLQTKDSIDGQIEELRRVIDENASPPVVLIGWSWGAWLSFLFAAKYPNLVKKLILVNSGPFKANYAEQIMPTRLARLSEQERNRVNEIIQLLQTGKASDETFNEFGELMNKADSFKTIPHKSVDNLDLDKKVQTKIYEKVWGEAEQLRKTGKLLETGETINCPVIAIHGDYDPHPAEGVEKPLLRTLKNFKFILIKNCGHHPWFELEAKDEFYEKLKQELAS